MADKLPLQLLICAFIRSSSIYVSVCVFLRYVHCVLLCYLLAKRVAARSTLRCSGLHIVVSHVSVQPTH